MKPRVLPCAACALWLALQPCAQAAPRPKLGGEPVALEASDGWKITARYKAPPEGGRVVLFLHAMGGNKDEWAVLAERVEKLGYGYMAPDLRGHGESLYAADGSSSTYKTFARQGTANEFNQMTRDIEAVLDYLSGQGIGEDRVVLAGAGLGANLAIRTAALSPSMPMMLLIGPTLNASRDVLAVNPLRVYGKRPVLILVALQPKRVYDESALLKAVAQLASGKENVTFISEYKGGGTALLNYNTIPRILQWLKTPSKPPETDNPGYDVSESTEPDSGESYEEQDAPAENEQTDYGQAPAGAVLEAED